MNTSAKKIQSSNINSDRIWRNVIKKEILQKKEWEKNFDYLYTKKEYVEPKRNNVQGYFSTPDLQLIPVPPNKKKWGKNIEKNEKINKGDTGDEEKDKIFKKNVDYLVKKITNKHKKTARDQHRTTNSQIGAFVQNNNYNSFTEGRHNLGKKHKIMFF